MNETTEDIVHNIIDEASSLIFKRMKEKNINYDMNTEGTIFFDDHEQKKTFCITFDINECDEYGGED